MEKAYQDNKELLEEIKADFSEIAEASTPIRHVQSVQVRSARESIRLQVNRDTWSSPGLNQLPRADAGGLYRNLPEDLVKSMWLGSSKSSIKGTMSFLY